MGKQTGSSLGASVARTNWNPDAELNHYLESNHTAHDQMLNKDKIDLLAWWKDNENTLPGSVCAPSFDHGVSDPVENDIFVKTLLATYTGLLASTTIMLATRMTSQRTVATIPES
ncbi:hypothetical protein GUJ93_ZPchr0013g35071 [Zizania palustris]|uniref:HAT C-terminal dimerisation domain-containing protein n=1 Tax=Zizania palustris TaxID=103762 RepID=A0A8J5X5L7_ZIZPA|nr:hypothetical protein GUJ93_ZPchr0013g35071 [Zizania palustris]